MDHDTAWLLFRFLCVAIACGAFMGACFGLIALVFK